MKERPILFSAPMVRAILDGRKTQTRRVVKPQPVWVASPGVPFKTQDADPKGIIRCPCGAPGDRLWVRENGWERPDRTPRMLREGADTWAPYYFDADGLTESDLDDFRKWGFKRRPSIHMPRSASRITLEINGVRVERLNEISEEDAKAEGCNEAHLEHTEECDHDDCALAGGVDDCCGYLVSSRLQFKALWESINGPASWDKNPWVWVIQFKKIGEKGTK